MSTYLPTVFGENLMDMFDDFENGFFRNLGHADRTLYGKHAQNLMKTDVRETGEGYELDIDLPGFNKDELSLDLNNGYLTISTHKTLERKNEGNPNNFIRQERYAGTLSRSFYVGDRLTEEDIKAAYENGVLHITIPKKEETPTPERRTIRIEG